MFNRVKIRIAKMLDPVLRQQISRSERLTTMISLRLMHFPDTELLIHPSKEKFYIHTKDDQFLIVIDTFACEVTLSNHKYQYDLKFCRREMNFITGKFIETTEVRRDNLEAKFLENTEMSLQMIYNSTMNMLPYID